MHVYGGIFAIQKYHDEITLEMPQPGQYAVLTPRLIWYQPLSIWIIWFHVLWEELFFALSLYRLNLDPVFPACNLLDDFQSVKHITLRSGMGHH